MISLRDNYSMRILSMRIQAESSVSRGYLSSILNFPSRVQVKHQDGCTEFTAPIIRSRLYTFLGNLVFFCAGLDCVCKRLAKVSLKLDLTVEKKEDQTSGFLAVVGGGVDGRRHVTRRCDMMM